MNNLKKMTLASLVAFLGFSQIGTASAGPRVSRASKAQRIQLRTDLRCEVEAFRDAGATQSVANGATLVNLDHLYVRYTVRNAGRLAANGFNTRANAHLNANEVFTQQQVLDLPAGFSASFPLTKVNAYNSSTVKASLSVDTGSDVTETSELNNLCNFQVTSQKLH